MSMFFRNDDGKREGKPKAIGLPLLPLRDIIVFPHMIVPLFVGREKSVAALEAATAGDKDIFLVAQLDPTEGVPGGIAFASENFAWVVVDLLHRATKSAVLVTPYFVPDATVLQAMSAAAMRGELESVGFEDLRSDVRMQPCELQLGKGDDAARGGLVEVEGIGILHQEFAAAHHAKARTLLVAELPLDMVEIERQALVGFHVGAENLRDHFLVGRPVQQLALVPVGNAQHFRAVGIVTAALAPEVGEPEVDVELEEVDPGRSLGHGENSRTAVGRSRFS